VGQRLSEQAYPDAVKLPRRAIDGIVAPQKGETMSVSVDVRTLLDPDVAAALAAFPMALGSLSAESLPIIRQAFASMPALPLSDAVERTDHDVPARPGVNVRVHRPKNAAANLPCIYWMHGGGLVLGTNKNDDARFDRWCQRLGCVGVSVEYALAPESRYPGPLEDCYAGLRWVRDNAASLGVDVNRIGVSGASAGAGLAAGLALLARDRAEIQLAFQALIYRMLDDRMVTPSSSWDDPVWPPAANRFGWGSYLGDLTPDAVPIYAAAARATDLSNLPRTFISVGALDGFSDEDIDYAVRMRHAGVPTELHVYPGAPHGFDGLAPDTAIARRANRDIEEWLAAALR
jgi:acetyl esterase/lipase